MAITVDCPGCQSTLRVAARKRGTSITCPKCSTSFVAGERAAGQVEPPTTDASSPQPPLVPQLAFDDAKRPPRRRGKSASLALSGWLVFAITLFGVVAWLSLPALVANGANPVRLLACVVIANLMGFVASIVVFLWALRALFLTRDWVACAVLIASALSFLVNGVVGGINYAALSMAIGLVPAQHLHEPAVQPPR